MTELSLGLSSHVGHRPSGPDPHEHRHYQLSGPAADAEWAALAPHGCTLACTAGPTAPPSSTSTARIPCGRWSSVARISRWTPCARREEEGARGARTCVPTRICACTRSCRRTSSSSRSTRGGLRKHHRCIIRFNGEKPWRGTSSVLQYRKYDVLHLTRLGLPVITLAALNDTAPIVPSVNLRPSVYCTVLYCVEIGYVVAGVAFEVTSACHEGSLALTVSMGCSTSTILATE